MAAPLHSANIGKLKFIHLPAYVTFLLESKLEDLVHEQLHLSRSLNIPILKYFESLPSEHLFELSKVSTTEFLTYLQNNDGWGQIAHALDQWENNLLPLIGKDQVVAEDITLSGLVRKKTFIHFLPDYSQDMVKNLAIIEELDDFNQASEAALFNLYFNIQSANIARINAALLESNELHKKSQAISHLGNWSWIVGAEMFTWSDELYRVYGLKPQAEEITWERFESLVHPDDRQARTQRMEKLLETHEPVEYMMRIVWDDGTRRVIKGRNEVLLSATGKPYKILGTCQDFTNEHLLAEQLEQEKMLAEALTETNVDMIAAYDRDLRLIVMNRKAEERFGMKKANVLGKSLLEIFPYLEGTETVNDLHKALAGETIHYKDRKFLGTDDYYESFVIPIRNSKNEVSAALALVHDITEIKRNAIKLDELNTSLERKNRELEASNKELASFGYVASHDLQEPLRKIKTFSDMISEKDGNKLSEPSKSLLARMDASITRMQTLIQDLLSFSTLLVKAGKTEQVDLNLILQEIKDSYENSASHQAIKIEIEKLPIVQGVAFQLQQVFENLIGNSVKYSYRDRLADILVICKKQLGAQIGNGAESSREYYTISVKDNGIGFEQKYAEKIFEIFQRLHNKDEYSGTGIGLAICKRIIDQHEGIITAKSSPNKGSTFEISLPLS